MGERWERGGWTGSATKAVAKGAARRNGTPGEGLMARVVMVPYRCACDARGREQEQ